MVKDHSMKNCIETASGRFVNLLDPQVEDIVAEDIMWSLSRMPRFAGHSLTEIPYTVGQHSVYVHNLVEDLFKPDNYSAHNSLKKYGGVDFKDFAGSVHGAPTELLLEALLHDASEAYLMDLPTPVKNIPGLKEEYTKLEYKMTDIIRQRFNLSAPSANVTTIVKWADAFPVSVESYHLIKSRGKDWVKTLDVSFMDLQKFGTPKPALEVYSEFNQLLSQLCVKLRK